MASRKETLVIVLILVLLILVLLILVLFEHPVLIKHVAVKRRLHHGDSSLFLSGSGEGAEAEEKAGICAKTIQSVHHWVVQRVEIVGVHVGRVRGGATEDSFIYTAHSPPSA
jgi:hypothetical protein